jgi:hypothetical protein
MRVPVYRHLLADFHGWSATLSGFRAVAGDKNTPLAATGLFPLNNGFCSMVNAAFTALRDHGASRTSMTIRNDINAIDRGAATALVPVLPSAALILGGLLLLTRP